MLIGKQGLSLKQRGKIISVLLDQFCCIIIIISFSLIRKRFFLSHIYRNRLFRHLTFSNFCFEYFHASRIFNF